jgi:hypothetical protein
MRKPSPKHDYTNDLFAARVAAKDYAGRYRNVWISGYVAALQDLRRVKAL